MRKKFKIISFIIFVVLLFSYCSEKERKIKKTFNSTKGKWENDIAKQVHLSLELTLGGLEDNQTQVFQDPRSLAVNEKGNFFILDQRACLIHKFDENGRLLGTIGRRGQGPGEFQTPYDILFKNNTLYVADLGNRQVHSFDESGNYISGFQVRGNFVRMAIDSKGDIYIPYYTDQFLIHKYSKRGELLNSFVDTKIAPMKGDARLQRAYNNVIVSIDRKDNIFVAYTFQNRIQKYNSHGELLLEFNRELPFKPIPIYMFQTATGGSGVRGDEIHSDIQVGKDGLVYVLLGKFFPEKGRIIDRYNSDGEYLDCFWTGVQCYRFVINANKLYLLDPFDLVKIYRYSMTQ